MVTLALVALALWFGFELGRKWDAGIREAEQEALEAETEARRSRGGVRLKTITIRR